jgi:hypothetical protein
MPLLEKISNVPSGTTLSWQCSRSTTNAISEVLLFCVCVCVWCDIYLYVSSSPSACAVCVCACVCVVQSIFESILEYLSIYLSIYLRMYLSICSWSLPCQRCLCWSLPFVCVCVLITAVPMKKLFAWGDWCVCVTFNYFALVLSLYSSTGVAVQQVFAAEHSGVSLLGKQSILEPRI